MAENHEHEEETRPPAAEAEQPPVAPAAIPRAGGGRFRRWSRSAPAQFVAVGLLAGLVGGLVGGGIVAAVGGGHDQPRFVRIDRGVPPWWGPREFRRPRGEPFFPMRPGRSEGPRPAPTTTS